MVRGSRNYVCSQDQDLLGSILGIGLGFSPKPAFGHLDLWATLPQNKMEPENGHQARLVSFKEGPMSNSMLFWGEGATLNPEP